MTTVTLTDTSQDVTIPDGFVPLVWELAGGSLTGHRPSSRLHLAPADQGARPYKALCGRSRGKGRLDPAEYASAPCQRCLNAAR